MNGKYEKEIQWSLVIKNTDITILIITKNCRIEASEFFTWLEKWCMVPNQTVAAQHEVNLKQIAITV